MKMVHGISADPSLGGGAPDGVMHFSAPPVPLLADCVPWPLGKGWGHTGYYFHSGREVTQGHYALNQNATFH